MTSIIFMACFTCAPQRNLNLKFGSFHGSLCLCVRVSVSVSVSVSASVFVSVFMSVSMAVSLSVFACVCI